MRALVLSLLLVVLPAASGAEPSALRDDLERERVVPADPQRLVSQLPSVSELVCTLGACDRLVGVDTFSNHPEELRGLPRVGGLYDANVEAIVGLRPDLVLSSVYGPLPRALDGLRIPNLALRVETFDDLLRVAVTLGTVLGVEERAQAFVSDLQSRLNAVTPTASAGGPRVYLEIDAHGYSAAPDSYLGKLLGWAGGSNVVPTGTGSFPQVSPELVVARDPEVIVLLYDPGADAVARLATRPGWAGVTAVREGRVCVFGGEQVDLLSRPGPRIMEGVDVLRACLERAR